MTVHVEIIGHSGFTTPPTVVVAQPAHQAQPQGEPTRPTLRLVR